MAEYVQCSNISFTVHNGSGWLFGTDSNAWKSTSYATSGGVMCFGLNSSSQYRALVIKFNTPSFPSGSTNKKIHFTFPVWRGNTAGTVPSAGTIEFRWRTFSTAPNLASQSAHNYLATNDGNQLTDNYEVKDIGESYTSHTFTINASNLISNQTYYLFVYSDTPTGNTIGCMSNNYEEANYEQLNVLAEYTTSSGSGETPTVYYAYIQYHLNGGSGIDTIAEYSSTSSSIFYKKVNSTAPTKEGYTFKGWATSSTSTTVNYNPGDDITLYGATGNGTTTNLYAIWEENTVIYTYDCYDMTNNDWINTLVYETETTATSITSPIITGYEYEGYSVGANWSASGIQYTGNTCTQHSASKPIIIFYYTETPPITTWQTPVQMASIRGSLRTEYSTSSTVNKYNAGYVKYTTPSYAGKIVFQTTSGVKSPDYYSYLSTSTLDARTDTDKPYRDKAVTGTILVQDDDGASGSDNYDTLISYEECNASTDYYWYVNAAWASSGTYTIPWKLNYYRKYTITYHANDGTGAPSSQSFYEDNTTVSIPSTTPTRPNYTFLGWSTNASATNATYTAGSSPTLSTQNYTLYAVWELSTYSITITYDANGGIGAPPAFTDSGNVGSNINIQISSTEPTRDRHIFKGWADGNSTTVAYQSGQTYPFSSNKTLYAVWENKFGADNVYYGIKGEWKLVETYYGVNGQWVPLKIYYGNDNEWKNNT